MCICIMCSLCVGCESRSDIEDMDYVFVMGIDYKEDMYTFTYAIADIAGFSGNVGKSIGSKIWEESGKDFIDINLLYKQENYREIDYGHVSTLIVSKNLIEDKDKYEAIIKELYDNQSISKNTKIYMADTPADILAYDDEETDTLDKVLDDYSRTTGKHTADLSDMMKVILKSKKEVDINKVEIADNNITITTGQPYTK